jgi:hypothetical protein
VNRPTEDRSNTQIKKHLNQASASSQISSDGHRMKYVEASELNRIKESSFGGTRSSHGGHIPLATRMPLTMALKGMACGVVVGVCTTPQRTR